MLKAVSNKAELLENLVDIYFLMLLLFLTLAKFDMRLTLYNLGLNGKNGWLCPSLLFFVVLHFPRRCQLEPWGPDIKKIPSSPVREIKFTCSHILYNSAVNLFSKRIDVTGVLTLKVGILLLLNWLIGRAHLLIVALYRRNAKPPP